MVTFVAAYERALRGNAGSRDDLRLSLMASLARALCERAGIEPGLLASSSLCARAQPFDASLASQFVEFALPASMVGRLELAHRLGQCLDVLGALEHGFDRAQRHTARQRTGSFFTPPHLARALVEQSVPFLAMEGGSSVAPPSPVAAPWCPTVCDPAVGGGAFLLEATRALVEGCVSRGASEASARQCVFERAYGQDRDQLAVWVAEFALWLFLSDGQTVLAPNARLAQRDSLRDEPFVGEDFGWIVGNPPWVAYQGRAARPLPAEERAFYRQRYSAFRGYPTLHGLFVERAGELAPRGVISLLLPSSLSDLEGYRPTRTSLERTHRVRAPLKEFGEDAFEGVVQPCFGLVATPEALPMPRGEPWPLEERTHHLSASTSTRAPDVLARLAALEPLPREIFGELGLQTNREVSQRLLLRAAEPRAPFELALLEGRSVQEFSIRAPSLFMHVDRDLLARTRCSLRSPDLYGQVDFVVRQTAAFPIAARHDGSVFRNSLLAGYARGEFDETLLVGLMNSALYRAFHVAGQRDARQSTFPQVKLSHLRRLPRPPAVPASRQLVRELAERAEVARVLNPELRRELDDAVFALFGLGAVEAQEIRAYLQARAPGALNPPKSRAEGRSRA